MGKRPAMADDVQTLGEAERWRIDIVKEVAKKIAEIQNGLSCLFLYSLSDFKQLLLQNSV